MHTLCNELMVSNGFAFQINEWPLESFCEELCNDLFNPSWEVSQKIYLYFSLASSVIIGDKKKRCHISLH